MENGLPFDSSLLLRLVAAAWLNQIGAVRLVAARLNQIGVPAQAFDAWDVGILTDSNFMDARLLPTLEDAIYKALKRIDPVIVAVATGCIDPYYVS